MVHEMQHATHISNTVINLVVSLLFMTAIVAYTWMGYTSSRQYRIWPRYRYICWYMGCVCTFIVMVGPLATAAHSSFRMHMIGHLLLGMLGPLLIALSAPITLLLRNVPVRQGRRLTRLLRSPFASFVSHPITAVLLNTGGLWILYTTVLYTWMHEYGWVNILVHLHIWLAGYLFTISILYIDPVTHRYSYMYRAIAFITAGAFHSILAKYLYAYPPSNVNVTDAQSGALWMYYGGDIVQLFIILIFCYQWYQSLRVRSEHTIVSRT